MADYINICNLIPKACNRLNRDDRRYDSAAGSSNFNMFFAGDRVVSDRNSCFKRDNGISSACIHSQFYDSVSFWPDYLNVERKQTIFNEGTFRRQRHSLLGIYLQNRPLKPACDNLSIFDQFHRDEGYEQEGALSSEWLFFCRYLLWLLTATLYGIFFLNFLCLEFS